MSKRHLTKTAVYVMLERERGEIFFLRRANTGWADGLLTFPAGHVDKGESILHAAAREVREEAGVEVREEDLEFLHVDYIRDECVNFYFRTHVWSGTPHLAEPHASSEVLWVAKENVPKDVIPQLHNLFSQVEKGSYFSDTESEIA